MSSTGHNKKEDDSPQRAQRNTEEEVEAICEIGAICGETKRLVVKFHRKQMSVSKLR